MADLSHSRTLYQVPQRSALGYTTRGSEMSPSPPCLPATPPCHEIRRPATRGRRHTPNVELPTVNSRHPGGRRSGRGRIVYHAVTSLHGPVGLQNGASRL